MSLAAGALNRQITVQQRTPGTDGAGQPLDQWVTLVDVWAAVAGQTGMRTIATASNGVVANIGRYSFRIRYREGLEAGLRVLCATQAFAVREVRNDMANREWTDLVCDLVSIND